MVKKVLIGIGGATVLGMLFVGSDALSYITTGASRVKDSVKNSVPIEFEIDRARKMVRDLVPDIRRNMHVIAKEEVEVARLEEQIENAEAKLSKEKGDVLRLKNDLSESREYYTYNGRSYTVQQVKHDLANRFARYKTNDATLESLRQIREARAQSLAAARQKLEGMLASKRQLEVEVENLEARLKMVEVAQTSSEFNFDDSRLGRAKELVSELKTRLQVAERLANSDVNLEAEIPLDGEVSEEHLLDEVSEYFEAAEIPADEVASLAR